MKNQYYIFSPRNFANEYETVRVSNKDELDKLNDYYYNYTPESATLRRTSIKELRQLSKDERIARKYDNSFSGYCCPWEPVSVDKFKHYIGVYFGFDRFRD